MAKVASLEPEVISERGLNTAQVLNPSRPRLVAIVKVQATHGQRLERES